MRDMNDTYDGPEHHGDNPQQADCPLDLKNFENYPCSRGDADCDICKAYVAEEREREG